MSTTVSPISRDQFRRAVRRNVRALLALHDMRQQDLAPLAGLNESQLSDRMQCKTAWKDEELLNVARAFPVAYEAVVALDREAFEQALLIKPEVTEDPRVAENPVQGVLFAA